MRTRLIFLRIGVVVGALLTCAPVIAIFGTMLGMTRAFNAPGGSGISDPQRLSQAIAGTLLVTAGGFVLFPVGLGLLIVCWVLLTKLRRTGPPPLPRFRENFVRPPEKD